MRLKPAKVAVLLISLLLNFQSLPAQSESLGFAYFLEKQTSAGLLLDPVNGNVIINHLSYPAKFISDRDFFAIESEVLKVAIPKKMNLESWIYANHSYRNLGKIKIQWQGKLLIADRIASDVSEQAMVIYNTHYGILGFELADEKGIKNIWLKGRCGYGAQRC